MTGNSQTRLHIWFSIEKSMRYHQRRRGFFEGMHRGTMFLIILFGSAAFQDTLPLSEWYGLVAAIAAALDLVIGFSHRARDHQVLYQRFSELAQDISMASAPSDEQVAEWKRRRLSIETDEPPVFWALEASCFNEVLYAWEWNKDEANKLRWYHQLLMHVWPFGNFNLNPGPGDVAPSAG